MAISEIRTWEIKCDDCNVKITVTGKFCKIPDGWLQISDRKHLRERDLCPNCAEKKVLATQQTCEVE